MNRVSIIVIGLLLSSQTLLANSACDTAVAQPITFRHTFMFYRDSAEFFAGAVREACSENYQVTIGWRPPGWRRPVTLKLWTQRRTYAVWDASSHPVGCLFALAQALYPPYDASFLPERDEFWRQVSEGVRARARELKVSLKRSD